MVWSEYNRSSPSVEQKQLIRFEFNFIFRRIATNEFDKQVNVHVAMDNTIVLEEIRSLKSNEIKILFTNHSSSFQVNYVK